MHRRLTSVCQLATLICAFAIPLIASNVGAQEPIAQEPAVQNVRVKLMRVNFPVDIEGDGLEIRGMTFKDLQKIALPRHEQLTLDLKVVNKNRIWIAKKGSVINRTTEPFVEVLSSSGKIRVAGFEVPTPILLSPTGSKTSVPKGIDVVAALKLNDYLEGVLSGEMPSGWPLEALKAQAVAARSYTLFQIKTHKNSIYQLEGSILDQAYVFNMAKPQQEKIRQAIEDTEDMILNEGGRVVKAYYHADCGGQTEDPTSIWGGVKKIDKTSSVVDEKCAFSPHGKWNYEVTLDDLQNKLRGQLHSADAATAAEVGGDQNDAQTDDQAESEIKDVRVVSRTPSQRAALIAFNDGERDLMITGNELRKILGYSKLKSTLFSIERKGDSVQFIGRGFGHGSGLCQWGARFLADKGTKFRQILSHYYPHAKISTVDAL